MLYDAPVMRTDGYSRKQRSDEGLPSVAPQNVGTISTVERIPPAFCDHEVKTLVHLPHVFYDVHGHMVRRVMKLRCVRCGTVFTEEWDRDD